MFDDMKRFSIMLMAAVLVMAGLPGCFPDDYLEEQKPVVDKEEQGTESGTDQEEGTDTDDGTPLELNVVGRYLMDAEGNVVNLHGFGQTFSPFFNNWAWNNYDALWCVCE